LRQTVDAGERFDLMILDYMMPGIDGLELAHWVRSEPALAGLKLLMLSSYDLPENKRDALAAGINDYLLKPVKQSRLLACIANLMNRRSPSVGQHAAADGEFLSVAAQPQTGEGPEKSEPTRRVLLVEDNAANQKLALLLLKKLGYEAQLAVNGREALQAASFGDVTLILMDCQMPEMDGFEATQEIRQQEQGTGRHIPIIAMTANAMQDDRQKCLQVGMDDYVSKPINPQKLKEILDRWANK